MPAMFTVGQLAARLRTNPRWITAILYQREVDSDACPLIGGRRFIPESHIPLIVAALRSKGYCVRPIEGESTARTPG